MISVAVISRLNYTTYEYVVIDKSIGQYQNMALSSNDIMVSFKSDKNELNEVFNNYFDIVVNNWTWDYSTNIYLKEEVSMGEKCTPEHFLDGARTYYDDLELDEAICLKKDLTIELLETGRIQQ